MQSQACAAALQLAEAEAAVQVGRSCCSGVFAGGKEECLVWASDQFICLRIAEIRHTGKQQQQQQQQRRGLAAGAGGGGGGSSCMPLLLLVIRE